MWVAAVAAVAAAAFGALAVVVATRSGAPLPLDTVVHQWAVSHRTAVLTTAAVAVTSTGTGAVAYGLAAASGAVAVGRRRWWQGALAGAGTLALCQAVRWGISIVINRARPPQADWATAASGFAFPSGHTTTAAVVAVLACFSVTVRRLAPRRLTAIRWLVVAWAVAVGLTRVYLGVHWPTDVLGGWLLALALTFGLWATVGPRLRPVLRSRPE